jgi:flavin reductase (DIM6/NTAB) family NADH-FMN oxidoreductase RutF
MKYNIKDLSSLETYRYLTHLVAPRPIALVSTIDRDGNVNLSPFSFFNLFSSNPPIVIFSPLRKMRDNTMKHTLRNVLEVPEVVINIVTRDMIVQTSVASCEYEDGVDEFLKAGFTKESAVAVKPPMILEAKAKLECHVVEVKPLGHKGGAGNLIICEVMYLHMDDTLYNEQGQLDPRKLNLAARLGGDFYCEVNPDNVFLLPKPTTTLCMGMEALPPFIRNSKYLTNNEQALLANIDVIPDYDPFFRDERWEIMSWMLKSDRQEELVYEYVRDLIHEQKIHYAWQLLLHYEKHSCAGINESMISMM